MYNRFLVPLCRPKFSVLNRIQTRGVKIPPKELFISSITEEYQKMSNESQNQTKKQRDDRRKRIIRYIGYNPTAMDKLMVLKARFFATGWVYLLCGVFSLIAVKLTKALGKYIHRDRYAIERTGD